jgi:hypothetical protein
MATDRRIHIVLGATGQAEPYRSRPGRGPSRHLPGRDRRTHGTSLLAQINTVREQLRERQREPLVVGIAAPAGAYLEFRGEPNFDLVFESLDVRRSGIELRAVRTVDGVTSAVVYVPEGKTAHFVRQIEAYLTRQTRTGRPRYESLIGGISEIRRAALASFWTDTAEPFPGPGRSVWWEVWLRRGDADAVPMFTDVVRPLGVRVDVRRLDFPERTVLLVFGTPEQLASSTDVLESLAELRLARPTPAPFMALAGPDQREIGTALVRRLTAPKTDAPAVCLLDTGVNQAHPLLAPALEPADVHACNPAWGGDDHHGHGTAMAGVALYGDLAPCLSGDEPLALTTRLESAKLLPPAGENPHELYGALTIQAAASAEIRAPGRPRVFCLTVSRASYQDRGAPSSWSAAVDALASGYYDEQRRLVLISAGNVVVEGPGQYPDQNLVETVHDPGQSWNALTVGGATDRVVVEGEGFEGWTPVAPPGGLSPTSSTSTVWGEAWPFKPDIVCEAGNMVRSPDGTQVDYCDAVQLLTTFHQPLVRLFQVTGDTSAATAAASRMAALVYAEYPRLWPETVRALLVHSAEWTDTMWGQFAPNRTRQELHTLLRCCGFGIPRLDVALWSAANAVTLIVEDDLQPFDEDAMNEMHLHSLPWPRDVLLELAETPVELRVTLSYFVEPNPGSRGWTRKFRYMSHGLRFDVKTPEESLEAFRQRMNHAARLEAEGQLPSAAVGRDWLLGPRLRSRGSLHTDRWTGTAAQIAECAYVGVYPVIGWWRERHHLGRSNRQARYSLIVSLRTPDVTTDLYTPILAQVRVPVPVPVR